MHTQLGKEPEGKEVLTKSIILTERDGTRTEFNLIHQCDSDLFGLQIKSSAGGISIEVAHTLSRDEAEDAFSELSHFMFIARHIDPVMGQ